MVPFGIVLRRFERATEALWLAAERRSVRRRRKRQSNVNNIVRCTEESTGHAPKTLREVGLARIADRQVRAWTPYFGSYGMGGPGFFELLLDSSRSFSPEHLVLTLWGAADWLLLDGRWVSAHPNQYARQRPMYSAFIEQGRWDEVSPVLVGSVLKMAVVEDDQAKFYFERLGAEHVLELPRDTNRLPIYGGSQEQRSWFSNESLLDAWVVTTAHLLC